MNGLVAIPVYNESENLLQVIQELESCIPSGNLFFIDDGSIDGSDKILQNKGVNYVKHPINLGYTEALRTGIIKAEKAEFEFVVFFDSDGQHRAEDLMKIIQLYEEEGFDLIIGSRYNQDTDSNNFLRSLGTKFFSKITSLFAAAKITDVTCGLKLITRNYLPLALKLSTEDMHAEFIVGLALAGAKIKEVDISVPSRVAGNSMYHFVKAFLYPAKTVLCIAGNIIFARKINSTSKKV